MKSEDIKSYVADFKNYVDNLSEDEFKKYIDCWKEQNEKIKSARELFEELGYKLDEQEDYLIYYKLAKKQRVNFYHTQNEIQIEFNFTYKTIEKRELFHTDEDRAIITLRELQAINQQINELDWK